VAASAAPARQTTLASGVGEDASDASDDGRRAGLLVGLGIASIALVALAASAVLVAFVGEKEPVTISGPSIEAGEVDVPAEVLGVEVEAESGAGGDRLTAGTDRGGTAAADGADGGDGETAGEGADASTGQSALIEPFAIPTPTPETASLQPAPSGGSAVAGPTQPPAVPGATATPRPTATPATIISAPPPPPSPRPAATPTPQTIISAPPAPTGNPTPTVAPAPTPSAVPPTATPVQPSPTPDPVEVIDSPS
jgi:hypothetical protein